MQNVLQYQESIMSAVQEADAGKTKRPMIIHYLLTLAAIAEISNRESGTKDRGNSGCRTSAFKFTLGREDQGFGRSICCGKS